MGVDGASRQLEEALEGTTRKLEALESERLRLVAERRRIEAALGSLLETVSEDAEETETMSGVKDHDSKYRPLWLFLRDNEKDHLLATFADVEEVLGFRLPASSRRHLPYWYGYQTSPLARSIRDAGWRVRKVDLGGETLQFLRIAAPHDADVTIEKRFDYEMVQIYEQAKSDLGYNATRFLQMVYKRGGIEAARHLIHGGVSDGFEVLWEKGRLDLSVEALVAKPAYAELFTAEERKIARDRLRQYGYGFDQTPLG